jgi:transaldolase
MAVPRCGDALPAGATQLEALHSVTRLCVDTADLAEIATHKPEDVTTNPSLLLRAAQRSASYRVLAEEALYSGLSGVATGRTRLGAASDALAVLAGREVLKLVPGRVSTETDARLAYDASATVQHALSLISMYESVGVDRSRVYIKCASTWEGLQAVRALQSEHGVACNCTLLFSLAQAAACVDAGAAMVSPFVGRITDWYREHAGWSASVGEDPGVASVKAIYGYVKAHGPDTAVMGASFRNVGQIQSLAGIDVVTVSPTLLNELATIKEPLTRVLGPTALQPPCSHSHVAVPAPLPAVHTKSEWEARLGTGMARDKLAEGIAQFARDAEALEQWLAALERAPQ